MSVLGRESDNLHPYRVESFDKRSYLDAETAINEERRVRGLQPTKNYINRTSGREVMTALVVEEWCKGTPLDTTIYREALHNNIHCNNQVEGLVVLFTS